MDKNEIRKSLEQGRLEQARQWIGANAARLLLWEEDLLHRYADYGRMFGCQPGENIFRYVLVGALTMRGLTLEEFDARRKA